MSFLIRRQPQWGNAISITYRDYSRLHMKAYHYFYSSVSYSLVLKIELKKTYGDYKICF